MGCTQIHFDVPIYENIARSDETRRVVLTKITSVHIFHEDPCSAPLQLCIKRVVKCQSGCVIKEFLHDIPINPCDPILPPGEYELSIPETYVPLFGGIGVSLDVVFEDVSLEYVQVLLANGNGGCS